MLEAGLIVLVAPIKLKKWFLTNHQLVAAFHYGTALTDLVKNEIGQLFGRKIVITKSKKKQIIVRIDKLVEKQ